MSQAATLTPETSLSPTPESDKHYEILNGRRVEKPPMGNFQVLVASILVEKLAPYARAHGLGRIVSEMLFKINPDGGSKRRPDVAFVSYERWARARKLNSEDGWDVIPDLAIEVISPSNSASEVVRKDREYFRAGVRRVWVVYPLDRLVCVHESAKKSTTLEIGDELDGEDILPGFRLSLAELFEDGEEA